MERSKSDEELIQKTEIAIAELVYDKDDLLKAYNYYNCKRDPEQFKYLEELFGLGNPTSVSFTPLIRKHVDALIGEFLETPILPKISCKDTRTINNITREKELRISREVYKDLQKSLRNKLLDFMESNDKNKLVDPHVQSRLDALIEDLNNNYISQYEEAAQDVIQYILQDRRTDFSTLLWDLLKDLLITGYTFYTVKPSPENTNVQIEVLDPLNTFIDKNPNSHYVKDSYRVVVRRWLTKSLILQRYGREMSKEDIKDLRENWKEELDYSAKYIKLMHTSGCSSLGIVGDHEAIVEPGKPVLKNKGYNPNYEQIPVYEVEWLETDKDFKMLLYQTVRIGLDIFILRGKKEDVVRTLDNPSYCSLTVNGVYFDNRNDEPFSLVLACADLQDRYDLLIFYRDNLIANSGTTGDWIDESLIPVNLGINWPERLKKWISYKKQGIGIIDTTLEGRAASGQAPMNTIFNGFDDTVKVQAIQAIQVAILAVEETVSSITGVFRERLNGIEAHDAVTNIKIGLKNSFTISKQWYTQMDIITEEVLTDCLNVAKSVYKNGLTGTLILGEKFLKIFTALPEHLCFTNWDIHIVANSNINKDIELLKALVPELVKAGGMPLDTILDVVDAKSMSEAKYIARNAIRKLKEENNLLVLLQQLNQQMQLQMQELQKQLLQSQQQVQKLDQQKMQLEQLKLQSTNLIEMYKAETDRNYKEQTSKNDSIRTQIELDQLHDGNPYNDEVKNV